MKALVFGGRSPIALALCARLNATGSEVHLVTRRIDETLTSVAREASVASLHELDLTDEEKSLGLLELLDVPSKPLTQVAFMHRYRSTKQDDMEQYRVEVLTPARILGKLAQQQRATPCNVVLTTSPAAHVVVGDQPFQYHASKAAISQLVRFGAVKYAADGLRVNGLSPGSFVFKTRATHWYAEHPEVFDRVASLVPAGRMATVEEVAAVGAFLLSDESRYIYGQIMEVDGGLSVIDQATRPT